MLEILTEIKVKKIFPDYLRIETFMYICIRLVKATHIEMRAWWNW